jgi:hypothetical protein
MQPNTTVRQSWRRRTMNRLLWRVSFCFLFLFFFFFTIYSLGLLFFDDTIFFFFLKCYFAIIDFWQPSVLFRCGSRTTAAGRVEE